MDAKRRVDQTSVLEEGLVDLLPVGILRTDSEGRCLSLNAQGSIALGIPVDRAMGTGWMEALEPEVRGGLIRRWARGTAEANPFEERLLIRPADKTQRAEKTQKVVSCQVVPLPADSPFAPGFLATLLDVTDWQTAEETLRKTTRELEARVQELACLFEISRAVERSAGSLPAILSDAVGILSRTLSIGGVACARIVMDDLTYQSETFDPDARVIRAGILVHGKKVGEIEVGLPPGFPKGEGELSASDHRGLLDAVAQRLGRTAERIGGRQLLREREEEMRERLTHLTRVSTMGEMASSIAHEVNQPLTAIATYAQACKRLVDGGDAGLPRVMEVLHHIAEEALRAGGIIHRLKDMVRRQESRWAECDLNALILDVERLASVDARLHDVTLSFHLAPDLPSIMADRVQIQQVVLNLIRNGIDAVEESGGQERAVMVSTLKSGSKAVRVSVADDGGGLPSSLEEKLFQPFFTTKESGMGMGLSISKSIATAHRGRISFSRNAARGMTFHLTLPAFDAK